MSELIDEDVMELEALEVTDEEQPHNDARMIDVEAFEHDSEHANIEVLKLLLSRLAQILAQEADMLDAMEINRLGGLQKEKKALVDALEKQKKLMMRRSGILDELSDEEAEDLQELVQVFESILQENHKRLLVAKEVNAKVVQAIAELANENAQQGYYTPQGERAGDPSVSVSLNRSI